jgi:YVTN family beta-propeller protein
MGKHGGVLRLVVSLTLLICRFGFEPSLSATEPGSPCAIALGATGTRAYVACAEGNRVVTMDLENGRIRFTFQSLPSPSGLALSTNGSHLWVVYGGPSSFVSCLEVGTGKETWRIPVGHSAMAPVASKDQKRLYVCNRFNNDVSVIDLTQGRELQRIEVAREPVVLDDLDRGAANPWGIVWTSQGDRILLAHAGTHEVSVIDAPPAAGSAATPSASFHAADHGQ